MAKRKYARRKYGYGYVHNKPSRPDDFVSAFDQGYDAYSQGIPYGMPKGKHTFSRWHQGWSAAQEDVGKSRRAHAGGRSPDVVLYTDAGWRKGKARCGFVAICGADSLEGSWDVLCGSSAEAEAEAVLFGLQRVQAAWGKPNVLVRTDCKSLLANGSICQGEGTDALAQIHSFCFANQIHLTAQHVKAHQLLSCHPSCIQ